MSARAFIWPHGKRIAVTVNAMLETWSEGKAPPYSVQASPKVGAIDHSGIAWGSYGGKVGVYRIIALLDRHGMTGTFCVNARCAEIYPEAVGAIVAHGHDVAGHGYLQDQLLTALEPEEEQAAIRRSLDILAAATGRRPEGWISPVTAFTAHTRRFLAADKLAWHGDARDSDLPSVVETGAGSIVQIPGSDFTDNRVMRSSPQDIWDVYKETFDYLREREPPAFLALSVHCHFGGRPMIAAVYDKIFGYMRQHDDVWFSSFGEVARWVMETQRDADTHARRLLHPR
ncbi:MAG: polysaccharide deacetylase family protein [Hyphomicrobiales bacterium]|nr:polysaccharide deacetylase family protein [Hyphomicrobiales bacterium]